MARKRPLSVTSLAILARFCDAVLDGALKVCQNPFLILALGFMRGGKGYPAGGALLCKCLPKNKVS